ncbi:MAG: flavodoxin family protein [bacterium]
MKTLIIVHSETGNTKLFAEEIKKAIEKKGLECGITQIETDAPMRNYNPSKQVLNIINLPEVEGYDYVLLGGPVMAFSANAAVMKCIRDLKSLKGRKFIPFVTQHLPFPFLGGTNAIRMMSNEAKKSGAEVLEGGIINIAWHDYKTEMKIKAEKIASLLKS